MTIDSRGLVSGTAMGLREWAKGWRGPGRCADGCRCRVGACGGGGRFRGTMVVVTDVRACPGFSEVRPGLGSVRMFAGLDRRPWTIRGCA